MPFGKWAKDRKYKELGAWTEEVVERGAESYALAMFTRVSKMSAEEAEGLIRGVVEAVKDKKVHSYHFR